MRRVTNWLAIWPLSPYRIPAGAPTRGCTSCLRRSRHPRPPGQPGHGNKVTLRKQLVRIVDGRVEGGYTDMYELICPSCGDHRDLNYSEISPRLQWLRGPHGLGKRETDEEIAMSRGTVHVSGEAMYVYLEIHGAADD